MAGSTMFEMRYVFLDSFVDVRDRATRNERIHSAMRVHEYTLKELSLHLGLHYSTISVIVGQVEKARKHQNRDQTPLPHGL